MSDKKPSKRGGRRNPPGGRPANGDYPRKIFARITDEQHQYIKSNFASHSEAIRAAIDCLMAQDGPPPAIPPG